MKQNLLSVIAFLSLGLGNACAATRAAPANSGIDVQLKVASADPFAPRPEGIFHVRGIGNGVSVHVPAAPLDPGSSVQRVPLPPGSYSVSYSPVVIEGSIDSLRNRAPAKILSTNPFVIVVGEGNFVPIDVLALAGAAATPGRSPPPSLAER